MTVAVARSGLEHRIQEIIEASLNAMEYRLVRVRYQFRPPFPASKKDRRLKRIVPQPNSQLQLMLERADGQIFGIQDCTRVHRHASALLDVADPIEHGFQLEVSSAGILRPLTRNSDFTDYVGHCVEITLAQILNGRRRFKGLLLGADGTQVKVQQDDEEFSGIPLQHIAEARLLMSPVLQKQIENIDNTEI
ncbi:MAG: ribosome maturation factor RimP [Alphaproteobacteria bacterium]|nr:ribosome maturation factor RimP [Alphaproteobacteria bacterium]